MSTEQNGLFPELTPPPGGAERFARRLDEAAQLPATLRWRSLALAGVACVVVALAIAVLLSRDPHEVPSQPMAAAPNLYDAPEFDRLLGRAAQPTQLSVTIDARTASVVEVETFDEKVRIYRVN